MQSLEGVLQERLDGIDRTGSAKPREDQRHLDQGTDERAYWHHGYASALKDILQILQSTGAPVN